MFPKSDYESNNGIESVVVELVIYVVVRGLCEILVKIIKFFLIFVGGGEVFSFRER